jgi:hypothetical protein
MGWDVHTHLAVECDHFRFGDVRKLATEYLPKLPSWEDADDAEKQAVNLLTWLTDDRAHLFEGNGGDLLLWGYIRGKPTDVKGFVELLRANGFWLAFLHALNGPKSIWPSQHHILVFEEQEQSEQTIASEIFSRDNDNEIVVNRHLCPFCFNQG